MLRSIVIVLALVTMSIVPAVRSAAQVPDTEDGDGPPFSLPFAGPPGPNTWLYEQHYGNTTAAFNYGDVWYQYGQGLHFGLDLEAACGTPVLAIADGVVAYVDAEGFGAGPHNLVLDHPGTGYVSLYGHLSQVPLLVRGQTVQRGEQVGVSGDPDGSCESRPHLHLEIRRTGYQAALNPLPFFAINWHMLASVGPFVNTFQQDLDTPYRWMRLEDQPEVSFSGNIVNNYLHPWPPKLEKRAPVNPPPFRRLDPLPEDVRVTRTPVALDQWNIGPWWNPTDPDAVYLIDAVPGQASGVFRQPLDGAPREYVDAAPPLLLSPDGTHQVRELVDGTMRITRLADGAFWDVQTAGNYPAVSPGNQRLLWEIVYGEIVPGTSTPSIQAWVRDLEGGTPRLAYSRANSYSLWLDDDRILVVQRVTYTAETDLYVVDVTAANPEPVLLGSYRFLHDLQISPGGERIAFFLTFQENPAASGLYVQRTLPGIAPQQVDFFGATRWRDDRSLYTLSFDLDQDAHALGVIDALTGQHRLLTDPADLPIRVANGDWHVSPDGSRIVYVDPADYGLYLLTVEAD